MARVIRESADQFQIHFRELSRSRIGWLIGRAWSREAVEIDPYLVGRAVAEVMRECTVRSAAGRHLLWNDYRVILARADFERLRALGAALERELTEALATEVAARGADLLGELRVAIVADEADELEAGRGVVRVAFVPTERQAAPFPGEMTVRFDTRAVAAGQTDPRTVVRSSESTVLVPEARVQAPLAPEDGSATAAASFLLRWPAGEAYVPSGATFVLGRPHPDPPERFVALTGASPRISKQHLTLAATPLSVKVGRLASANPVHVDSKPIPAGGELEAAPPFEISLSLGDLIVVLTRA